MKEAALISYALVAETFAGMVEAFRELIVALLTQLAFSL
jgi:hypothetical protein